jgi:hypothetical protein
VNIELDAVRGRVFYDPQAETDCANSNPIRELTGPATALPGPERKTGEEIHRALFSAQ